MTDPEIDEMRGTATQLPAGPKVAPQMPAAVNGQAKTAFRDEEHPFCRHYNYIEVARCSCRCVGSLTKITLNSWTNTSPQVLDSPFIDEWDQSADETFFLSYHTFFWS
jgi:hypothetical protein